jgi:membrane protease YdiL (CAAX protease family)
MKTKRGFPDKKVIGVFTLILITWIGAWHLKLALDTAFAIFATEWFGTVYWVVAKFLIWILPALGLLKKDGRTIRGIFHVPSWRKCLAWGCGIGGILTIVSLITHYMNNSPIFPHVISFSFLNVIVISPFFEEFIMHGAIMSAFRQKHSFLFSNTITAVLFVLLHCPGWHYTGVLWTNLSSITGGAISIFVIGWLCGLATEKSHSVTAGVIVHFLNNLV